MLKLKGIRRKLENEQHFKEHVTEQSKTHLTLHQNGKKENSQEDIGRNQEGVSPHQFFNPGKGGKKLTSRTCRNHRSLMKNVKGYTLSSCTPICQHSLKVYPHKSLEQLKKYKKSPNSHACDTQTNH
ncbi:hypothetical protein Fmac_024590 [Flemingia macrophylla]|uniref:Uncharacterized protein n=1 Tax=Flemingia macrophylla TaxID=520843 RepID=A0ABD1LPT7_9FABA